MCLYNTSFPESVIESVIVAVAVCIVEPNQLCAFSSSSFLFPFFSFLNIFPEQFSPKALDRAVKCREERETDRQRQRERERERLKNTRPSALEGNLVQSLNKDKRKLNSEGHKLAVSQESQERIRAGKRSDVGSQPTQAEEEMHVGGRRHRMEVRMG